MLILGIWFIHVVVPFSALCQEVLDRLLNGVDDRFQAHVQLDRDKLTATCHATLKVLPTAMDNGFFHSLAMVWRKTLAVVRLNGVNGA